MTLKKTSHSFREPLFIIEFIWNLLYEFIWNKCSIFSITFVIYSLDLIIQPPPYTHAHTQISCKEINFSPQTQH